MPHQDRRQPVAAIELRPETLEAIGPEHDPKSRYLGTMLVDRVPHHFELLEVVTHKQRGQVAKHADYDDILAYHHAASGADGPYTTIELNGRQYVVLLDPFCR